MALVRSVVRIPSRSGIPEDEAINTFHFNTLDVSAATLNAITAALDDFYSTTYAPLLGPLGQLMSSHTVNGATVPIDHYEVDPATGLSGSPVGSGSFVLDGPAGNPLPAEVALTITFHADTTGVPEITPLPPTGPEGDAHPRARRRGRVYIPFIAAVWVSNSFDASYGLWTNGAIQLAVAAADGLRDSPGLAAAFVDWAVYSRRDGVARNVVGGWVDNAPDTQRRRGKDATSRTLW